MGRRLVLPSLKVDFRTALRLTHQLRIMLSEYTRRMQPDSQERRMMRRFDMRLPAVVRLDRRSTNSTPRPRMSAPAEFSFTSTAPVAAGTTLRSHPDFPAPHHADRRGAGALHRARHPRGISAALVARRNRRHDRRLRIPPLQRQPGFLQRPATSRSGKRRTSQRFAKLRADDLPAASRYFPCPILHLLPQPAVAPNQAADIKSVNQPSGDVGGVEKLDGLAEFIVASGLKELWLWQVGAAGPRTAPAKIPALPPLPLRGAAFSSRKRDQQTRKAKHRNAIQLISSTCSMRGSIEPPPPITGCGCCVRKNQIEK